MLWLVLGMAFLIATYLIFNYAAKGKKHDDLTIFLFGVVITSLVVMTILSGGD